MYPIRQLSVIYLMKKLYIKFLCKKSVNLLTTLYFCPSYHFFSIRVKHNIIRAANITKKSKPIVLIIVWELYRLIVKGITQNTIFKGNFKDIKMIELGRSNVLGKVENNALSVTRVYDLVVRNVDQKTKENYSIARVIYVEQRCVRDYLNHVNHSPKLLE